MRLGQLAFPRRLYSRFHLLYRLQLQLRTHCRSDAGCSAAVVTDQNLDDMQTFVITIRSALSTFCIRTAMLLQIWPITGQQMLLSYLGLFLYQPHQSLSSTTTGDATSEVHFHDIYF